MDQITTILVIVVVVLVVCIIFYLPNKNPGSTIDGTVIKNLLDKGDRIIAEVTNVSQKTENNTTQYFIDAQWKDPATNRTYTFKSQPYPSNPFQNTGTLFPNSSTPFPAGSYVLVLVDHVDRQQYRVYRSLQPIIIGKLNQNLTGGYTDIQDIAKLIEYGIKEEAVVEDVAKDQKSGWYYIFARPEPLHPIKPKSYISGLFPTQPTGYTPGSRVQVVYDSTDPKHYFIDLHPHP